MNDCIPIKRADLLLASVGEEEAVAYDPVVARAYNLSGLSKIVFFACDGKRSCNEIVSGLQQVAEPDEIMECLESLSLSRLIEVERESQDEASPGFTRRSFLGKVAMAPVIASVFIPPAAAAQSSGAACIDELDCGINPSDEGTACCKIDPLDPDTVCCCDGFGTLGCNLPGDCVACP